MHEAFIAENVNQKAIPIYPVIVTELSKWMADQLPQVQQWIESSQYIVESTARASTFCLIPNPDGTVQSVLVSLLNADDFLAFGMLPSRLPEGNYVIKSNNILTTPEHLQL